MFKQQDRAEMSFDRYKEMEDIMKILFNKGIDQSTKENHGMDKPFLIWFAISNVQMSCGLVANDPHDI